MQSVTELYYQELKPLIHQQIETEINKAKLGRSSSGGGSINANYLLKSGDTITGPIAVSAGVTIDGVDISVLDANAVPLALNVATTNAQTGSGHTHAITSSSYPAATASLLATTSAGLAGVQGLGIGAAGNASYGLYNVSGNPSHIANNLLLGTTTAGALSPRLHVLSTATQAQLSYDASNYGFIAVSSSGAMTLGNTGSTAANAHLYLNPGGGSAKVSIGNAVPTPAAKLEVNATTEQFRLLYSSTSYWSNTIDASNNWTMTPFTSTGDLIVAADLGVGGAIPGGQTEQFRVAYDASNYASFAVSSVGVLTVNTTGTTAALAHLLFNPGGKVGINMTGTPASRLEVRDSTGAQMRLSYDAAAYVDWQVGSGGNSTVTTYGSDLILDLQPTGGTAGLKFMRPANGYDINLGTLQKKWLSLYAAELVVENLIAFDTQATMGGRLLITPATTLTSDLLASGALGSIGHTGSNSAAQSTGSTSWVVTPAGGNVAGDFLIVCLSMQANSTVTAPGGWTQLGAYQDWGTRRTAYFYHFMAGGETTYTFTLGTSAAGTWAISGFSNVDTGTPVSALGVQSNTGTTNHTAPSVTASTTADVLVFMLTYNNNTADHTVPGSTTQRTTASYAAGFNTVVVATQQLAASGATGTRTATTTGSHDSIAGQVALKPTGSGIPTTLYSKYNNLATGDVLRFEAGGFVEFMSVSSGPSGTGPYTYTVTRNLDNSGNNNWYAGDTAVNMGQTGAGFIDAYAWNSAKGAPIEYIYNLGAGANLTQQVGYNLWRSSGVVANDAVYFGMGGGTWANINLYVTTNSYTTFDGICEYWNGSAWTTVVGGASTFYRDTGAAGVTLSSSGELPTSGQFGTLTHTWTAASQTGWAKTTINGVSAYWVRWRVVSVTGSLSAVAGYRRIMRGGVQYGPTIVGNVRNSSTYNDWSERWAMGNLHGLYDYGAVTYGFAAGKYADTWLAMDDANGLRIMNGSASLGQWDASGKITVGTVANNESRIEISPAGRISIFNRVSAVDTERFYVSVAGDLGLYGNGTNYVTINGTTGVVNVSGVINVTGGNALTTSTNYAGAATPGGPANSITGQGALATLNTVAWSSQITGRPIDNNGLLTVAATPAGTGLHLGSTQLGFYSGGQWRTYMDNSGNFLFRGAPSASVNVGGLWWNTSTGQLQGGYFAPAAGPNYGTYNVQWYTDAVSGSIYAGTGAVEIGKNGVQVGWGSHVGFGSPTTSDSLARLTAQAYYPANTPGEIPATQFAIERGAFGANLTSDLQSGTWAFTQATSDTTQLGLTGPINVTVGAVYEASTWAQFSVVSYTGTPDTQFEIRINWYNSGAGLISSSSVVFYCPSASDAKPRFVKVTGTAPATTVTARIEFRKRGIGSGGTSSHQVAYNRTALITYSLGSYINMKPTAVEIGDTLISGNLGNGTDGTGWKDLSAYYASNWQDYGGVWAKPQFKKVGDIVFFRGMVRRITSNSTANVAFATLPSGYRPASNFDTLFDVRSLAAGTETNGRIDIKSDGTMTPQFVVNTNNWISLNGIFFSVQ